MFIFRYLLEASADVHAQTQTGDTALTYACENGHTDVADLLLQYGADLVTYSTYLTHKIMVVIIFKSGSQGPPRAVELMMMMILYLGTSLLPLRKYHLFLISNFCNVLNVVCLLLGNSPAFEFCMPTFRNTVCVPSS